MKDELCSTLASIMSLLGNDVHFPKQIQKKFSVDDILNSLEQEMDLDFITISVIDFLRTRHVDKIGLKYLLGKEVPEGSFNADLRLCDAHFIPSDIIEHPVTRKQILKTGAMPIRDITNVQICEKEFPTNHFEQKLPKDETQYSSDFETVEISPDNNSSNVKIILKNEEHEPSIDVQKIDIEDHLYAMTPREESTSISISPNENCSFPPTPAANVPDRETSTKSHRVIHPRYVGDICDSHLESPRSAKRCVDLCKRVIKTQKKTIQHLSQKLRRGQTKIQKMEDVIEYLHNEKYISENASDLVVFSY